jgi:hypothetical protein
MQWRSDEKRAVAATKVAGQPDRVTIDENGTAPNLELSRLLPAALNP